MLVVESSSFLSEKNQMSWRNLRTIVLPRDFSQVLLQCKSTVNIVTFNIRTSSEINQQPELVCIIKLSFFLSFFLSFYLSFFLSLTHTHIYISTHMLFYQYYSLSSLFHPTLPQCSSHCFNFPSKSVTKETR